MILCVSVRYLSGHIGPFFSQLRFKAVTVKSSGASGGL